MQSVASLMSMTKVDIGNLAELDEDDEDEGGGGDSRGRQGLTSEISAITSQMQNLEAHFGKAGFNQHPARRVGDVNPFGDCFLPCLV